MTKVLGNGKRYYDPAEKDRLIDAALEPGVSIAGLALAHGINANQLRNWIRLRWDRQAKSALMVMPKMAPSGFVPVVEAGPVARSPSPSARPRSPRVRLKASLPNGVQLELEGADAQILSAMIEALGRCNVPVG
ncbi:IS66-like element accessory protein TnpA [Bosea thiooxidans]|uniref:IS66-like element accessory protein TnpA n=1 Tax=Bosea thiooxidans TaxID=53254 RepID=UPI00313ED592